MISSQQCDRQRDPRVHATDIDHLNFSFLRQLRNFDALLSTINF